MKSHRKDDMPPSLNRATRMGAGGIAWDAVARLRLWLVAFTFATTAAGISDTGGFRTLVQRGVGPSNSPRTRI
jgi:hypothetical protein